MSVIELRIRTINKEVLIYFKNVQQFSDKIM